MAATVHTTRSPIPRNKLHVLYISENSSSTCQNVLVLCLRLIAMDCRPVAVTCRPVNYNILIQEELQLMVIDPISD